MVAEDDSPHRSYFNNMVKKTKKTSVDEQKSSIERLYRYRSKDSIQSGQKVSPVRSV